MAEEKKKRSSSYSRTKGHRYEVKICNEIKELGYTNAITSRSESKRMDNNKIDIFDPSNELGCNIQVKITQNTPSYHSIADACPVKDKPLVLIWNRQILKEGNTNITSVGEVVMLPKAYFYELIKR